MSQQLPLVYRSYNGAVFSSPCTFVFEFFEIPDIVSSVSAINACVGGLCLFQGKTNLELIALSEKQTCKRGDAAIYMAFPFAHLFLFPDMDI